MIDTLIVGGRIIDGTGNQWFYGDIALSNGLIDRVVSAGSIPHEDAHEVIDAQGHVVCPGFIDIQSHSILPLLIDGRSLSKVTQGVTTEIMGEMWTPAPFGGRIAHPFANALVHRLEDDELATWDPIARTWSRFGQWLDATHRQGVSVNIGSFVGGGTIREYGMGESTAPSSPEALAAMKRATAESMDDGAFGIATALIYPPSAFADTAELTELMRVVADYAGVHITHLRSESTYFVEALAETMQIARDSGVSTEIYHLKASGKPSWHLMPEVIQRITEARAAGLDISANMYPYDASGTGLAACLPPWANEDGKRQQYLEDPDMRANILREMREPTSVWENSGQRCGPENVILAEFRDPDLKTRFQGRRLSEVADELSMPWDEAALWLLEHDRSLIFTMYISMSEDNMRLQFRQPWIKWGTDAGGVDPAWMEQRGLVHPRAYGTYPRILGRYARDLGWIPLEDAIRKATSAVAGRLGIRDRGLLREGMRADVVIFNPDTIIDHATYTDPHRLSEGVRDVWVNGERVVADGEHTGAKPGHIVRHDQAGSVYFSP